MKKYSAIVVGAGLGGIAAGVNLKAAGIEDFRILERSGGVGGTWRSNTYPGCGCDTQMIAYQFSFSLRSDWDSLYPKAPQILNYAEAVTEEFELRERIDFGVEVSGLKWCDGEQIWTVSTSAGETYQANTVFMALGQFSTPSIPAIPGLEDFQGTAFHSANWNHDVELAGARVAVVGSAASAVQLIPEVAREAAELMVFQRTPNWMIPRGDRVVGEVESRMLAATPAALRTNRDFQLANADALIWPLFEYTEVGREYFTSLASEHLANQVADPSLRARLTPNYPIGCKRLLLSDDFYPTLQLEHVSLVDQAVVGVKDGGLVSSDGKLYETDVIVWATGFDSVGWHAQIPVVGRDGRTLADSWSEVPTSFLGVNVPGFPNMFLAYGPNTNLGHGPVTYMLERQAEYFTEMVVQMKKEGIASVEIREEVAAEFQATLHASLAKSVWADPTCSSYYKTDSGVITKNWMGRMTDYRDALVAPEMEWFIMH